MTACSGDDGADGANAPAASNAQPCSSATIPEELIAVIEAASVPDDGKVIVEFSVRDGSGYDYACLASNQVRFAIAKLNAPGALGAGESSSWQSYINRTEAAPTNPVNGPGTVAKIQATTEASGTLTNNRDGSYRYVFNTNIKAVTTPLAVSYDAASTHRVALQISSGVPAENASHDWQPATGNTSGIISRNMVATESCNTCHGELALHGGGRKDVEYCVTCHNPGSSDANSGHSVDMAAMTHKIHRGAELPSVVAGADYAIWGYGNSKHDYSDVEFPQDIRNCRNCHDEDNAATPDARNWLTKPTAESCGSCHDDVNFVTGANHGDVGASTNAECSTCHVGGSGNQVEIARAHEIGGKADAQDLMALRIDSTSIDETNGDVQVRFSLINPSDNSVYTPAASALNFVSSARLYRNPVNPDNGYSDNNISFNISTATPNEAGQYAWDTNVVLGADDVLAYASRIRICTDEKDGGLIACNDARATRVNAPATPVWGNIDAAGEQVAADAVLKMGAEYERCATCHAGPSIAVHGGDYASLEQCRSCHNNSRLRDIGNLDLKYVIHAYHAGNLDDGEGGKEPLHYPNAIKQCTACHSQDQLDLPIAQNLWAPLTATGLYTSSTAFVCASCHLTTQPGLVNPADLSTLPRDDQAVANHMLKEGAVFNGTQVAANITETCSVCHSSGSLAAIDEMHGKLN